MKGRLFGLIAAIVVCAAWFFVSPLIGLSRLADAIASKNVVVVDERVDFSRLGRSIVLQIVWHISTKPGVER